MRDNTIDKYSKILVTGGTGFLGTHLINKLKEKYNIRFFDSKNCDLRVQSETNDYLFRHNPNVIIHLAATVGGIGANQQHPGKFCYENLIMGCNVIEAARLYCSNLEKFILVGTTCSYPEIPPRIPFKEADLYSGYPEPTNAPYGIAKRALITLLQSYKKEYDFPGISLIPTNLYGPGDNLDLQNNHVIPALIIKILKAKENNEKVEIWGDGTPTRDFLYVDDCADAIKLAIEKYDDIEPLNIGSGIEISILDLVNIICDKVGYDNSNVIYLDNMPNGQPRRCLDVTNVHTNLGWCSTTSLQEGLDKTIEWIKSQQK